MNAVLWFRRRAAEPEPRRSVLRSVLTALLVLGNAAMGHAAVDERALQITPPRVGFLEGDVSFWRPGAGDWEAAQVNIPLAAGDSLATQAGKVEVQIGAGSFIRAGDDTELRVRSLEPDFLQLELVNGRATADLRELKSGMVVQVNTPNAVLTVARDGYYRIDYSGGATRVVVRRAGAATLTPTGSHATELGTGESALIESGGQLTVGAAPGFDDWDRWSYDRADRLLAAPRSSAVSADVYGTEELEESGSWRYEPTYGRVWAPDSVPAGWAPYTYGRWLYDPFYGWSWVDYAPWGWAPYHYGRWVWAGAGYWGWAPGPVVVAPYYAPALVAWFGGPGFSVGIGFPFVSWVALGWGEPFIPWWGPVGFVGTPCWWGWGGPHVVNNIVINNGTAVNATAINNYRNLHVPGGVVSVDKGHFTDPSIQRVRLNNVRTDQLKPIPGQSPVEKTALQTARADNLKAPVRNYPVRPSAAAREATNSFANLSRSAPGAAGGAAPGKGGATSDSFTAMRNRAFGSQPQGATNGSLAAPSAQRRADVSPPSKGGGATSDSFNAFRNRAPGTENAATAKGAPAGAASAPRRYDAPPPLPSKGGTRPDSFQSLRSAPGATAPAGQAPSVMRRSDVPPPLPKSDSANAYSRWGVRPPSSQSAAQPGYNPPPRAPAARSMDTAKPMTGRNYANASPAYPAPSTRSYGGYGPARSYARAPSAPSSMGGGGFKGAPAPSMGAGRSIGSVGGGGRSIGAVGGHSMGSVGGHAVGGMGGHGGK